MAITASTWTVLGEMGLEQAITDTSATQKYKTGKLIRARDTGTTDRGEAEFVYAKGVASVVAGDLCAISPGGDAAVRTVARTIASHLGVAQAAIVASNWGWFQVSGRGVVTAATALTGTTAYLCATAGAVDDAVVAGDIVYGAKIVGATDTGQVLVDLNRPYSGDTDNT